MSEQKADNTYRLFLDKAQRYCSYQERSSFEVIKKLKEWGLLEKTITKIVSELCETDFLNNERYLKSYINNKTISKKWGKIKIAYHLRSQGFKEEAYKEMLSNIADEEYHKNLKIILEKKIKELHKEENQNILRQKIIRFCLSRGFEADIILPILNNLLKENGKY
ncbi:MAG: regulatory protein RecX [Bacteroidales bacterium]|nr:regulatory protein RecX [Bacteroidales bacterium]